MTDALRVVHDLTLEECRPRASFGARGAKLPVLPRLPAHPASAQLNSPDIQRVALWCAPHQQPSRLLRSFSRCEGVVTTDEPLAAAFLDYRRRYHLGENQRSLDELGTWNAAVDRMLGTPDVEPTELSLAPKITWVQKHLANHLLLHTSKDWLLAFRHVIVLSDPRLQLAAVEHRVEDVSLESTCVPHQLAIYHWVLEHADAPPLVLFEEELVASPRKVLAALCEALDLRFNPDMATPSLRRVEGDAGWYQEEHELAFLAEETLAMSAARHPRILRDCQRMQAEMMQHSLVNSGRGGLVT